MAKLANAAVSVSPETGSDSTTLAVDKQHYHCVGIGCGPSNLSIASLLHGNGDVKSIFFDSKPAFSWHDGMMMGNASLQVSLFKDLVTLADPTNKFSFISYLHSEGRLYNFLNAKFDSLLRKEFRAYLEWAARTNENVHFDERVLSVSFEAERYAIETTKRRVTSDHVIVGVGTSPHLPEFVKEHMDHSNFHVSRFLHNTSPVEGKSIAVVGGGQSGAEAFLSLLSDDKALPKRVTWVTKRENFFPIDDSPFTNEFYTPTHSNHFFEQNAAARSAFLSENILSSDGISDSTLKEIYQKIYALRYLEKAPIEIELIQSRKALNVSRQYGRWRLELGHIKTEEIEELSCDIVVWATGFKPAPTPFLGPMMHRLKKADLELKIDKSYVAEWGGPPDKHLFILNSARHQRGLADPNLSITAWRSQVIVDKMLPKTVTAILDTTFVRWHSKPKDGAALAAVGHVNNE